MIKDVRYLTRIRFLYEHLRSYCSQLEFCIDLSNIDELTKNDIFYTDWRHPNSNGNKIIANEIYKKINTSFK